MIKRHRFLGAVIALTAVLAACGGDDDDADSGTTEAPGGDSTTAPGDTAAPGDTVPDGSGAPDDTGAPADGASITIALGSEPTSLDPHVVDDGGERAINDNIYETLLARDAGRRARTGPRHRAAHPGRRHDLGVHAPRRRDVPRRHAVQRRRRRRQCRPHHASRQRGEDRQRAASTERSPAPTAVDDLTVRITTTGPDGVLPARMYWLKIVAPGTEASDDLSEAPNGTGPYTFIEPRDRRVHRARRQRRLLGWRALRRVGEIRVRHRGGDPARRTQVGQVRPDHEPRAEHRRRGAEVRGQARPGAPGHHPRRRRRHHRRPERAQSAQPGGRQGGARRGDLRRLRRDRRGSGAEPVDPRLQRQHRGVCVRPRRGRAVSSTRCRCRR